MCQNRARYGSVTLSFLVIILAGAGILQDVNPDSRLYQSILVDSTAPVARAESATVCSFRRGSLCQAASWLIQPCEVFA